MNNLIQYARDYIEKGISVIPLRLDGSKAPESHRLPQVCAVKTRKQTGKWEPFQSRFASDEELESMFQGGVGIGIVGGVVSNGLEILDFDDGDLFPPWYKSVEHIACKLPIVETPSLGFHVYYRCEVVSGNQKIATDPTRDKQTLIETRGQGGYVCGVESPNGIHKLGLYVQHSGPVLPEVPSITKDERLQLWKAARKFDRGNSLKEFLPKKPQTKLAKNDGDTPWDDFNRRASWSEAIPGWRERESNAWTRPGKDHGISAVVRKANGDGAEVLVVFSTNAGPLSPTSRHKTFSKFEAFKQLIHSGDGKAAVKAVRSLGYGGSR